jgi:hypothetical protein
MMRKVFVVAYLALAGIGTAQAQSLEDRLRAQLSSVTAQLRSLQDGQATLEAQKAAAERERNNLKAKLADAQAGLHAAQRHAPSPPTVMDTDTAKKLAAAAAEVSHLTQLNAALVSDKERLSKEASDKMTLIDVCQTKNAQAVQIAQELLLAYHDVGLGAVLAKDEPLTGLERVKFEQLEQDFGDKIYNSRLAVPARADNEAASQSKH